MRKLAIVGLCVFSALRATAAPKAFWVSEPVMPNQTALVFGDGFGKSTTVSLSRVTDVPSAAPTSSVMTNVLGTPVSPLQLRDRSVKFVVPAQLKPGVYHVTVKNASGVTTTTLNAPTVLWAQGDQGVRATPGGFIRVMGNCLSLGSRPATIYLKGPGGAFTLKTQRAELFTLQAQVPSSVKPGVYSLWVHNGFGGAAGWSAKPAPFSISVDTAKRSNLVSVNLSNVDEGGDATAAIQDALNKAGEHAPATVTLPRGRFVCSKGLTIPAGVTLKGAGVLLSALCWGDTKLPPESLIHGSHDFGVCDLAVYGMSWHHAITSDIGKPECGNIRIINVRLRNNPYRGHITEDETDRRFRESLKHSTGGGDSLRLGGVNIEVASCDIYGGGRAIYLDSPRGGWVHDNTFYNGRWGWYCLSGCDGLVFERNQIIGGDLMSTGGGLNTLNGGMSQNVFYADNRLRNMFGWDREAMTTDGGSGAYYGYVASCSGKRVTMVGSIDKADPTNGLYLFILDGKGQGQYRKVVVIDGKEAEVDQPWDVAPDATSIVTITLMQRNYLFVRNSFDDAGVAIQMYGTAVNNIAYGNTTARTAGYHSFGMDYYGVQPSWYVQWLNNRITDGNVFGGGHDQSMAVGEAHLGVMAQPPGGKLNAPVTLCGIIRGNVLESNAHIVAGGSDPPNPSITYPYTQEIVVEGNRVSNAETGMVVARSAVGVSYRNNVFTNCVRGISDEEEENRRADAVYKKLAAEPGPLLHITFDKLVGGVFMDETGHGFNAVPQEGCKLNPAGIQGACVELDGKSFLTVARPGVLRPTTFTLSVWFKTDDVAGRWGILSKRLGQAGTPFVLGETNGGVTFEAMDEHGEWTYNLQVGADMKPQEWHHLAAVVEAGKTVIVYADGREVGRCEVSVGLMQTPDPLCIGHESWGGNPASGATPAFFKGMIDDVQIWARALSPDEISRLAVQR